MSSYSSLPPLFRQSKGLRHGQNVAPSDKVGALPAKQPTPESKPTPTAETPTSAPWSWPKSLPDLGRRTVISFSLCADCQMDLPEDYVLKVGQYQIAVPGPRGTFVSYGHFPLCRRHARVRSGEARGTE